MTMVDSSRRLLTEIISSIDDGAAIFDEHERLVEFNDKYTQYFLLIKDILKPGISFAEMFQALASRGLYTGSEREVQD